MHTSSPTVKRPHSSSLGLHGCNDLTLIAIGSSGNRLGQRSVIHRGSVLIIHNPTSSTTTLTATLRLSFHRNARRNKLSSVLFGHRANLTRILVPPHSPLINDHFFPNVVARDNSLVILTVRHGNRSLPPNRPLTSNSALLLRKA